MINNIVRIYAVYDCVLIASKMTKRTNYDQINIIEVGSTLETGLVNKNIKNLHRMSVCDAASRASLYRAHNNNIHIWRYYGVIFRGCKRFQ